MDNFITTNECYTSQTIINKSNIQLNDKISYKYNDFISDVSSPYLDVKNYSFEMQNVNNSMDAYNECKNYAETNNSNIFLISDVLHINNDTYNYNCYLPKKRYNVPSTLDELINPFRQVLELMFNVSDDRLDTTNDISYVLANKITNDVSNINQSQAKYINRGAAYNKSCYKTKINDETLILPKTNSFGVFYNKLFDFKKEIDIKDNDYFIQRDSTIQSYINSIETEFTKTNLNTHIDQIKTSLYSAFCQNQNDHINHKDIDNSIGALQEFYDNNINKIVDLAKDISNIEVVSKYNRSYLTNVDEFVKKSNKKFKDILKLDSANNGKYNDTLFMKNHKISEIIILMLIIIILIFIYTKKK